MTSKELPSSGMLPVSIGPSQSSILVLVGGGIEIQTMPLGSSAFRTTGCYERNLVDSQDNPSR